jgi:16S rRNA (guanine966-N2)-methyltransferase
MRITGGHFRGRTLTTSGFHGIRPTTDRTRETMFNILANHCEMDSANVLDLCAGTGALAFESLSRGASSAVLVEKSRKNCALLLETAQTLGVEKETRIVCDDAVRIAAKQHTAKKHTAQLHESPFHLIFCDPPYAAKLINPVFTALAASGVCAEECMFVAEHDVREVVLMPDGWMRLTVRSFGETVVEFFQRHISIKTPSSE